ncbi:hypothetical protein D3C79_959730 [compost metagenome]
MNCGAWAGSSPAASQSRSKVLLAISEAAVSGRLNIRSMSLRIASMLAGKAVSTR